jgi:hypothetical protein
MTVMKTRLFEAADLVEKGWTQRRFVDVKSGSPYHDPAFKVCALGGMRVSNGAEIIGGKFGSMPTLAEWMTFEDEQALAADMRAVRWELFWRHGRIYPSITRWNDAGRRKKADVVAVLRAAGERRQRKIKRATARANLRG